MMKKDISNSIRRDLTDDHHNQIKAWIWETAVKLGFQDICDRIEAAYNLEDLIKKYFCWGKNSKFLHYIYELKKNIVTLEIQQCQIGVFYSIQKLSLKLLIDLHQSDTDIVTNLICVHHSASLLIFAKTGKLEIKRSSCLPTQASDWLKVKKIIGFKDDQYKDDYIQTANLVQDCKQAILKKNLSNADYAKSLNSLLPKLRHITLKLIDFLSPPTLIHFSKLELRKELQLLNSPVHTLILKHIKPGAITSQSLHSLFDELQDLSANYLSDDASFTGEDPNMKSKTTRANSGFSSQDKRMLVVPESLPNYNLSTPDHSSSHKRCSDVDILIIKGVAWDLRKGHLSEGQNKFCIQSRAVVDIIQDGHSPLRGDSMPICAQDHKQSDVIEVHLEPQAKSYPSELDPIRKVSQDLDSMDELIKNAKMLVAELEIKYKKLKVHKEDLIKRSNGKDVKNGKDTCVSTQYALASSESQLHRSPLVELFADWELPLNSNLKDVTERTSEHVPQDEILASADILHIDQPIVQIESDHSVISVSEDVPVQVSPRSIKCLSPQVKLTPIKQSLINKYLANSSGSLSCHLTTPENKKFTKMKRKSTESSSNDESPRNGSFSHLKTMQSSLSKIDLRVTQQHSSTESNVVVLESGKSSSSPFTCRVTPNKEEAISSDSISNAHHSTNPPKTTCLVSVNAVNLNSPPPKKLNTDKKGLKSNLSHNSFSKNKGKKKNRSKKSGKPFIITSSLWRSRIFSSSSSSETGESLSSSSPKSSLCQVSPPPSKSNDRSHSNQNSNMKQNHLCVSPLPSDSSIDFFSAQESPLQTTTKSSVQINSTFELDPGIYSIQNLSKIKKSLDFGIKKCEVPLKLKKKSLDFGIKKCEVPLKLKKIINPRWGVVDIYH